MSIESKSIRTITDPMENYPSYKIYFISTNYYLTEYNYVPDTNIHCPRNWRYRITKIFKDAGWWKGNEKGKE